MDRTTTMPPEMHPEMLSELLSGGGPADPAALPATVRAQIARHTRATEDEKAALAAPLRAFEAQYAGPALEGQLSDALTEAYGLAATELGLWDKAHSAFTLLAGRAHLTLQGARLRLAFVCRKQKRLEDAQALLGSIEGKTRNRTLYRNEVGRVRKALAARDTQDSALRARALLLAGDSAGVPGQVRGALAAAGLEGGQVETLMPVVDAALALYRGHPRPVPEAGSGAGSDRAPTLPDGLRIVSLSGFGWSGSGAVADFLRGRDGVYFPFGNSEVACFEGFDNCAMGANSVLDAADAGDLAELRRRAAMLILSGVLMALPAGDKVKAAEMDRWRRKAGLLHVRNHQSDLDGLAACCLGFVRAMDRIAPDAPAAQVQADTDAALRRLLDGFLALVAGDSRILVLNNCIHGYNIGLLRLLPQAVGVVVHRDPRDAFVARHYENTRATRASAPAFVKRLKRHYDRYHRQRGHAGVADQVVDIDFEAFLHDPALRTALLERLGLDPGDGGTGALRLEVSRGNIGIHADYPDQKAIARIARTTFRAPPPARAADAGTRG